MNDELDDKCTMCKAKKYHETWCTIQPPTKALVDKLRRNIRTLAAKADTMCMAARRYRADVNKWHGKFLVVKHENNVLRRKLNKQNES